MLKRVYNVVPILALAMIMICGLPPLGALEPPVGESRSVVLNGSKVHYTNYGSGDTALVFVHGWACDETVWRLQAPELVGWTRLITVDLPGHGQSDKPETKYTMDLYARAINAVIEDAKINSAILVAHSNGAPAIRQYYRKFPPKVRALVIVDGPLRPFVDAGSMEKFLAPFRGNNYAEVAGKMIDGITRSIADESLRAEIKTIMLRTPQRVAVSEFENSADPELWKPDKINVPVLMVLAKQPAWSAEYEQFVRGIVPDVDYQVWENVSHFLMMEKPREFNAALAAFLQNHNLVPKRS